MELDQLREGPAVSYAVSWPQGLDKLVKDHMDNKRLPRSVIVQIALEEYFAKRENELPQKQTA